MSEKVVNIVFGKLAESVLGQALEDIDRTEDIWAFADDLSTGPLVPLDGTIREKWMRESLHLAPQEWNVFPLQLDIFFSKLNSYSGKIVCWVCPNSIFELCGFYECMRQLTKRDLYYIDTMGAAQFEQGGSSGGLFPPRLAHISPVIAARLFGKETRLSAASRAERLQVWQQVSAENAPLRNIGPHGIQSVSLSYFDPLLLAFARATWQAARSIVIEAAVAANGDNFFRVDMMVLTGRLCALVNEGLLVADKDITDPSMNVRLR